MLPVAMTAGASCFVIYHYIPSLHRFGPALSQTVSFLQPALIFAMLFLTFCRIEPKDLKPHRWHWWLLLIQGGTFTLLGLLAVWLMRLFPENTCGLPVLVESAMLCLICPTATAAAVVTRKLGGDVPGITTYTILINLVTAVLVPLIVPLIHPMSGLNFYHAFSLIMSKVFPLLIMPCLAAWLVRYLFPKFHRWLLKFPDLAFYLWAFALTLAIAVTTKSIFASQMSVSMLLLMALISLLCCILQFALGRYVGRCYRPCRIPADLSCHPERQRRISSGNIREVTAGQALGQKNTVFAIWMGYTFMTPETAIVGGLYSIWHNLYNSHQLRRSIK